MKWWWSLATVAAFFTAGGGPAGAQALPSTHILIITGASGEPRFASAFHTAATEMRTAALTRLGVADSLVIYLAEDPARDASVIRGRSNREGVSAAIDRIADRARPGDYVFILLIGHGSATNDVSRFNLPGPDLTDAEFADLLGKLSAQSVAFINASSASGDFVKRLAAPNRVVITATKSGTERNETVFARYFVDAYSQDGADTDKDGRISLLEAFVYARREVVREYEQANKLLTEHAVLDDDGDGVGRADPGDQGPDGLRARAFFLAPAAGLAETAASSPRAAELIAMQRRLQAQIDSLRAIKAGMSEDMYQKALEPLLLKLAETSKELRALQVKKP